VTRTLFLFTAFFIASCAQFQRPEGLQPEIAAELARTGERKPPPRPDALERALLPPVQMGMPSVPGIELEQRFDLAVTNAPASQVFMSIVAGTRYSMLVHPGVTGAISVNLKDVTVEEALAAIRDLYGYEYRIEGTRVLVQGAGLQTRMFKVNYLPGQRVGATNRAPSARPRPPRRALSPPPAAPPRARSSRAACAPSRRRISGSTCAARWSRSSARPKAAR
jgi:MSHA biogenesis protein MshL